MKAQKKLEELMQVTKRIEQKKKDEIKAKKEEKKRQQESDAKVKAE